MSHRFRCVGQLTFHLELSTVDFFPWTVSPVFTPSAKPSKPEAHSTASSSPRAVRIPIESIVKLARERGIAVRFEDRGQLDRLANSRDHQGVIAVAAARAA